MEKVIYCANTIKQMLSPIVYIHKEKEGKVLYVGCSSKGIIRPFVHLCFSDGDSLEIIVCDSNIEAMTLEKKLILEYGPIVNRMYIAHTEAKAIERRKVIQKSRIELVKELRSNGMSLAEIAKILGVTRQRIHQMLHQPPDD